MELEMVYFHLASHDRGMGLKNGTRISVNEVLERTARIEPELWRMHQLPTKVSATGFEPTPQMEGLIQALCIALSGCVASIHDLKNIRRFMYSVTNEYKRSFTDPCQAAVFLAYLLVGFRLHPSDKHKEDSNSARDVVDLAMDLACGRQAHVSSFLCSHRGASIPGGSWLAQRLPEDRVRCALHLELGLLTNLPNLSERSVTWMQQGASVWAADTIFPELFLRYVRSGQVPAMLVTLAQQERQVRSLITQETVSNTPVTLLSIDPFLEEVEGFLCQRYGSGWRDRDFADFAPGVDPLLDIAVEQALPEVRRLLSFRNVQPLLSEEEVVQLVEANTRSLAEVTSEDRLTVPGIEEMTSAVIRRYHTHQSTHPVAKAIFDSALYYLWGKRCALRSGRFALGLDRDHSLHQREAWRLGHAESSQVRRGHGIVYARRCDGTDVPNRFLNMLSFRQFWR